MKSFSGARDNVVVMGGAEYATLDGARERDYTHVLDMAEVDAKAIQALIAGAPSDALNINAGQGYFVHQLADAVPPIVKQTVPVERGGRRASDPSAFVIDARKAQPVLGCQPRLRDLEHIIATTWSRT